MDKKRLETLKYCLREVGTDDTMFLLKLIDEDKAYGKDPEKLFDHLELIAAFLSDIYSRQIQLYNKQVNDGIEALTRKRQWVNLLNISKHALRNIEQAIGSFGSKPLNIVLESAKLMLEFEELSMPSKRAAMASLDQNIASLDQK